MNNTITAHIKFDFKGEQFSLEIALDLDQLMVTYGKIPDLYPLIARQHQIDNYSYEYEVMLTHDISYTNAQGWVKEFVNGVHFDQQGFEQTWREAHIFKQLAPLLKQHLNIDDIEQFPELKPLILAAYQLGKGS